MTNSLSFSWTNSIIKIYNLSLPKMVSEKILSENNSNRNTKAWTKARNIKDLNSKAWLPTRSESKSKRRSVWREKKGNNKWLRISSLKMLLRDPRKPTTPTAPTINKATGVTKIGIRKRPKVSNTDIRCFERNALKRDFIRKKVFDRMEWSYARKECEIGDPLRLLFPGPKSKKVIHKF